MRRRSRARLGLALLDSSDKDLEMMEDESLQGRRARRADPAEEAREQDRPHELDSQASGVEVAHLAGLDQPGEEASEPLHWGSTNAVRNLAATSE